VYTPAPDIIHEAAGHAPILVDEHYADYLKRIGEVGARAFSLPEDRAVYDAIYKLSEAKERPSASREEVAHAEQQLKQATQEAQALSEATLVSRLYWWTAEYGLAGSVADYKLYGAGLLSSLGESHSCQDRSVHKLPLSLGCTRVSYDITRAQPQLFVAESFEQVCAVLDELASTLAYRQGGRAALLQAYQSQELCTLTLDSGVEIIGEVAEVRCREQEPFMLAKVIGQVAIASGGRLQLASNPAAPLGEVWVLIGSGHDGASLLAQATDVKTPSSIEFELGSDIRLQGRGYAQQQLGTTSLVLAKQLTLTQADQQLLSSQNAGLLVAGRLLGARAGVDDPAYYQSSEYPDTRAPLARSFSPGEHAMIALYEQALRAHHNAPNAELLSTFERLHIRLQQDYPHDWLLRWNLLESLVKRDQRGTLAEALAHELARLEQYYHEQQPIFSGLKYLGY
jgi:phenylalanine-4-hydroxylase